MKKYIVTIIILFIIIFLSVGGYFVYANVKTNESNDGQMLKEKGISEVEYLGSTITSIMNGINNITYSNYRIISEEIKTDDKSSNSESGSGNGESNSASGGEGSNSTTQNNSINNSSMVAKSLLEQKDVNINWTELNSQLQEIYSSWPTIMMDLTSLNVNKDNLLKFNSKLDEIAKNFENKDEKKSLISLSELYDLVNLYIKDFSGDETKKSVFDVRARILSAYAYTESEDWAKVSENIAKAKEHFSNILNNQVNNMNKIDVINKSYILINELEQDSNDKSVKTFLVNYENLMQELQNI